MVTVAIWNVAVAAARFTSSARYPAGLMTAERMSGFGQILTTKWSAQSWRSCGELIRGRRKSNGYANESRAAQASGTAQAHARPGLDRFVWPAGIQSQNQFDLSD